MFYEWSGDCTGSDLTCTATLGGVNKAVTATFRTVSGLLQGDAADSPSLNLLTGGDGNWFTQTNVFRYGGSAFQSGAIVDNQTSDVQTTVTGPALVSFYWKVSSEETYDFIKFYVDGAEQDMISGEVDWQQKRYLLPEGSHTLKWSYTKDVYVSSGLDCGWLDKMEIITTKPTLTISTSSNGSGTVVASPPGTSCGSNCLEYTWDDTVTLTASAQAGSTFTGWSGDCTGSDLACTLTMDTAKQVTATFNSRIPFSSPAAVRSGAARSVTTRYLMCKPSFRDLLRFPSTGRCLPNRDMITSDFTSTAWKWNRIKSAGRWTGNRNAISSRQETTPSNGPTRKTAP
jgi:hypothetical protein